MTGVTQLSFRRADFTAPCVASSCGRDKAAKAREHAAPSRGCRDASQPRQVDGETLRRERRDFVLKDSSPKDFLNLLCALCVLSVVHPA